MMTRQNLYDHGRSAAMHALCATLDQDLSPTMVHPAIDREPEVGGCPTCGLAACRFWQGHQQTVDTLPWPPAGLLGTQDDVIALLDDVGTSRWAARWIRRGARDYLRAASEATGEDCERIAQPSLFFRGSGPWPSCEKRYVARAGVSA